MRESVYFRAAERRRSIKRPAAMLAVVVGGALLASCGSEVEAGSKVKIQEPALGPIPVIEKLSDLELPLRRYQASAKKSELISDARDTLVKECMQRLGIKYAPPEAVFPPNFDRVIGIISEEDVAIYGYRNKEGDEYSAVVDEAKRKEKESPLPGETVSALHGSGQSVINGVEVPKDGCIGEAHRTITKDAPDTDSTENSVVRLATDSYRMAEADSRVKALFARWRTCMAAEGHHYPDPWAANNDPVFATDEISAAEIETAKADMSCRKKYEINDVWVAVIVAYQNEIIANNRDSLDQRRAYLDARVSKAKEIAAGR